MEVWGEQENMRYQMDDSEWDVTVMESDDSDLKFGDI